MRSYLFLLLFVLTSTAGFSQKSVELSFASFIQEYNVLLAKQPVSNYQVTINNLQYVNATDAKPLEKTVTKLLVTKELCFAFESNEGLMIQNEKVRINVDTVNKVIYLAKPIELKSLTDVSGLQRMDSLGIHVRKSISTDKVKYILEQSIERSSFQTITIAFNSKTNHISSVEILPWPGDYLREESDEVIFESPKTVYEYTDYKKLTTTANLKSDLSIDYWLTDEEELREEIKNGGYSIKDLRIKK